MFNRRKRKKARRRLFTLVLLAVLVLYAFNYSNSKIVADEYSVAMAGLPQGFEGYRIALISDVHGNSFGEDNEELLSLVRAGRPDIIALTGDICDEEYPAQTVRRLLEQLPAIAPTYYVTGNHEWSARQVDTLMEYCEELGIKALRNEYVLLESGGDTLVLAGIDDKNGYADRKMPLDVMIEILDEQGDVPCILLSHRPDDTESFWAMGYDLVLAGHNHGGVVQIPGVGGLVSASRDYFPKFSKGHYESSLGTDLVVSAGLAGHLMPPRLFNPLHLPVVVLKGAE